FLDPPGFIPRDPEQGSRASDRAFPEEVDGEPLKEEGELIPRLGPWDRDLFDPMPGALHARELRFNPRPQLTRVQVPPPPRSAIIPGRGRLTLRARKRARTGIDFHRDLFSFDIHFHG